MSPKISSEQQHELNALYHSLSEASIAELTPEQYAPISYFVLTWNSTRYFDHGDASHIRMLSRTHKCLHRSVDAIEIFAEHHGVLFVGLGMHAPCVFDAFLSLSRQLLCVRAVMVLLVW